MMMIAVSGAAFSSSSRFAARARARRRPARHSASLAASAMTAVRRSRWRSRRCVLSPPPARSFAPPPTPARSRSRRRGRAGRDDPLSSTGWALTEPLGVLPPRVRRASSSALLPVADQRPVYKQRMPHPGLLRVRRPRCGGVTAAQFLASALSTWRASTSPRGSTPSSRLAYPCDVPDKPVAMESLLRGRQPRVQQGQPREESARGGGARAREHPGPGVPQRPPATPARAVAAGTRRGRAPRAHGGGGAENASTCCPSSGTRARTKTPR